MKKALLLPAALAVVMALSACSEEERRAARESQERIAAQQAYEQRLAQEFAAKLTAETQRRRDALAAETQRRKNTEAAETQRQFHEEMTALGKLLGVLGVVGAVIGAVVHSIRRLGEKHTEERTKRHESNLRAIMADEHISSDDRARVYMAAIEAANRGGTPLLSGPNTAGGAA